MPEFNEYDDYDALGLAELIARKEVTAREVMGAAVSRIEQQNSVINAVVHTWYDEAERLIADGLPDSPLSGVPFLLKDLHVLYADQPITNGCRYWQGYISDHDSTITQRYRNAGLVIVGRTNSTELGISCETAPVLYGPTRNPWNPKHSAGGSSGGAAAAVASGMLPAAHATDGGGSIRVPSFCCGLFGMKVSRGRNPYGPDLGEGWNGLSVGHVVTRSVRDSAAFLDISHGPAPGDPYAAPPPERAYLEDVKGEPGRLKIAFMTCTHEGLPIDDECARAVESAARLCEELGHEVVERRPDIPIEDMKAATRVIVSCNVMNVLRMRAKAIGREATREDVETITWLWTREALNMSGADYTQAVTTIHRIGRRMGEFLESYDAFLTPTFAAPPPPINTIDMMSESLDEYYKTLRRYSAFTSLFNVTGGPAMSVPLHWSPDGLPVGVQFGTRLGEEGLLFRLATQLEQARPWWDKRPAHFGLGKP